MEKTITCFIAGGLPEQLAGTVKKLNQDPGICETYLLAKEKSPLPELKTTGTGQLGQTETLRRIAKLCRTPYLLICTKPVDLRIGPYALERFLHVARDTQASMIYSDYYEDKQGTVIPHPLIDYQPGSLRDDFNFGSLLLFDTEKFRQAVIGMDSDYNYAALYDLRLRLSQKGNIIRIAETLYTEIQLDTRRTGEKNFDYVDPKNRNVQIEMEKACTCHLKKTGAWLPPALKDIDFTETHFPVEASVIIPVRNRERTIADAVNSVLTQKTQFTFNIIVVDNHSTDNTTNILKDIAEKDKRLIHILPARHDLAIGGCWNTAVMDSRCGRFCIQLDSDDLYSGDNVIQQIVTTFHQQRSAAVIGTYRIVNFNLQEIPPGLIDHKEWTPENGHNNALRINGLGAPRAFYTPVLRKNKLPNTSYGEDYAVMLAISRNYRIARIYEPLYLCRRWDDNSDASLTIEKENANNLFKDRIRTFEFTARQNTKK